MHVPIRLRLTLVFAFTMAIVLSVTGFFIYSRLATELLVTIDDGLRARGEVLSAGSRDEEFTDTSGSLIEPDESFAQILDDSGRIVDSSPAIAGAPLVPADELGRIDSPKLLTRPVRGLEDKSRLLVIPETDGAPLYVVVGATLESRKEALDGLLALLVIGAPAALVISSLAGWVLAGAALRPVERLRREASAISISDADHRLPVPDTGDELARLATTLNSMLDRLQDSVERERHFVDAASHELRTPLGIMRTEMELALRRARSAEELERALRNALEETERLSHLAEDLLVLSRAQGGLLAVHRADTQIAGLIDNALETCSPRARREGIRLEQNVEPVSFALDPLRVRQAVDNLLDNAVRHTPTGGLIEVRAKLAADKLSIEVEDSGPGFPPGLIERAFEPFASGDGSHRAPGFGLGLAIVRAIAEGHGGTVKAENTPGGGARLTLVLSPAGP